MKEKNKKTCKNIKESLKLTTLAFTLVELLAVIVILAIILVIAVPKVMSVIEDAKKATLESTAKMIASQAEKQKVQNTVLGNEENITCEGITNINKEDYPSCEITFDDNTAKVTIVGGGKFDGLYVCNGTKTEATATDESCTPVVNAVDFATDDWATIVAAVQSGNYPYEVGNEKTIELGELGEHIIRVANTTPCEGLNLASQTACGFVLEFKDIIEYAQIHEDATNLGGWPDSNMREYLNNTIYNAIPQDLRNGIVNTYVISSHGNSDVGTREDSNYESTDKIYLLSLEEIYSDTFITSWDSSFGASRQLDYYDINNVSYYSYNGAMKSGDDQTWWWLRSAYFNDNASYIYVWGNGPDGGGAINSANYDRGVSPAFRIG